MVVDQYPAHRHGGLAGRGDLKGRRARRRHELDEAHRKAEQGADEARRLIQQQAEEERRAISAERLRIARDLHDIVAHSISVIAVQAGVAHHIIDERPQVAGAALSSIEVTAREGLVEMRRMLGMLRSEDDATDIAPTTPAQGLRDLDRLMSHNWGVVRTAVIAIALSPLVAFTIAFLAMFYSSRCLQRVTHWAGGTTEALQVAADRLLGGGVLRPRCERRAEDDGRHRLRPGVTGGYLSADQAIPTWVR